MTVAAMQSSEAVRSVRVPSRLLVTRQDPYTRRYLPLGFLSYDGQSYRFAYFVAARDAEAFHPLPGLPDASDVYVLDQLFPIFAERVISARRPDRHVTLHALGLSEDAAPFELLARSGGQRVGDTIEVLPVPIADPDGWLGVDFLVHGVRYRPEAQERISGLRTGEHLRIVPERDNEQDPRALLVTDTDEVPLGYVPSPLLDLVHDLSDRTVTVLRANGPEVGFHFRLLVRVAGRLPAGHQPFSGPEWETVG